MIDYKNHTLQVLAYEHGLHMLRRISKRHFDSFSPSKRIFFIISMSKFNQEKKYIGGYILQQYGKLDCLLFQAQATQDLRGFGSFQNISHERLVWQTNKTKTTQMAVLPPVTRQYQRGLYSHRSIFILKRSVIFLNFYFSKKSLHWFYFHQKIMFSSHFL